jgi:hypothetical protein
MHGLDGVDWDEGMRTNLPPGSQAQICRLTMHGLDGVDWDEKRNILSPGSPGTALPGTQTGEEKVDND